MTSKAVRADGNITVSTERVTLAVGVGHAELMGEVGVAIFVLHNLVDFGEFLGRVVAHTLFAELVLTADAQELDLLVFTKVTHSGLLAHRVRTGHRLVVMFYLSN